MKALSIKSPLSYLVAAGIKDVENRNWTTNYRGRVYIHSCGTYQKFAKGMLPCYDEIMEHTDKDGQINFDSLMKNPKTVFFGKENAVWPLPEFEKHFLLMMYWIDRGDNGLTTQSIIGYADLVDVVEDSESEWALPDSDYYWIFKNAVLFKNPISQVKGKLRLWNCQQFIERR